MRDNEIQRSSNPECFTALQEPAPFLIRLRNHLRTIPEGFHRGGGQKKLNEELLHMAEILGI
jgi:hypothetical protein